MRKKIWLLGSVFVTLFALTGCGQKTVKLDKYVTITAEGYDSVGKVSCQFDYDAFEKDYSGKIKLDSKKSNDSDVSLAKLLTDGSDEQLLLALCVDNDFDQTENLSNGDVVTLKWNCKDSTAEDYFHVKLDYSNIEYTVKDLKEVQEFNPFDYIDVSFSGTSPEGRITITKDTTQKEMESIDFSATPNSNIKNGDTITVTASATYGDTSFTETYGSILSETEKTYTCNNLAYYAQSTDEIPDDMMSKMITQGEDALRANAATKGLFNTVDVKNVNFAGNYFLKLKNGMSRDFGSNNYLYLIYEVEAQNPDPEQTVNYYYYVCFHDILLLEDGTCSVDLSNYTTCSGSLSGTAFYVGGYRYEGYTELDTFFNNCIVDKIDKYEYEENLNN